MLGSCETRAAVGVCRYAVSRGMVAASEGVAMTGVGGALASVREETGVLWREEEGCSRAPPDFAPFLDGAGGMAASPEGPEDAEDGRGL